MEQKSLVIIIPTYKRSNLLTLLLQDLLEQTRRPDCIIIVDGDPDSKAVLKMLTAPKPYDLPVTYVPSNHANVAYQRYLGWRAARDYEIIIYLDDDLRIPKTDVIEKLIRPLNWSVPVIAGVTCKINFPASSNSARAPSQFYRRLVSILSRLGSSRVISPGSITPIGDRIPPIHNGEDYVAVKWLYGGVMGFRSSAFDSHCFTGEMFAMAQIGCGMGEDTIISRCALPAGDLLLAFCTSVDHPNADQSRAYPHQGMRLAYARAYSRRLLNDYYRYPAPTRFFDRLALIRHYWGTSFISWIDALVSFRRYRYAYALGYTRGAARGLMQKPTARKLTPHIDWWKDAEDALANKRPIG